MPEQDFGDLGPEDEVGRQVADALRIKATDAPPSSHLAATARGRIRRRRQALLAGAASVVVALVIGGVWQAVGGMSSTRETAASGDSAVHDNDAAGRAPMAPGQACPAMHPISVAAQHDAVPPGIGLDLNTPVTGLTACRYKVVKPGEKAASTLLGSATFDARRAQAFVNAIKPLPEVNPSQSVFDCSPEAARPREAIVLRFGTAAGIREIWVGYDGCVSAGFFTGHHTYGLYGEPLRMFATGFVRPPEGNYLTDLQGW